ncbi:hypothetical protein QJS66_18985 [Kocuria rhizophila]|nr:hypothetical protein QJS66_18985 [Kocuria rhizophila]
MLGVTFRARVGAVHRPRLAAVQALAYVDGASTGKAVVLATASAWDSGSRSSSSPWPCAGGWVPCPSSRRHRLTLQRVGAAWCSCSSAWPWPRVSGPRWSPGSSPNS